MEIKHKSEWPRIVKIGKDNNLDNEQIIILLALREFEDGPDGYEFRCLEAIGHGLEQQTLAMAKTIKWREFYYQKYLKRLVVEETPHDFIEYLSLSNTSIKPENLRKYVDLINSEFEYKKEKVS